MFDQEIDSSGFSVGLCVFQLIAAPFECAIFGFLVGLFFEGLLHIRATSLAADLLGYLIFSSVGFALGYVIQIGIPRSYQSAGRWVWVLPVSILVLGFIDEFRRVSADKAIVDYFVGRPDIPDSGLGMVFFAWPAVATCFYSAGLVVANRPTTTRLGIAVREAVLRSPITALAKMF
jgi:hypothetical protein